MSKLSRFKKAPAIKLPSKLTVLNQRQRRNRFDEDSEDDDFVKRPEKQSASLRSIESLSTKQDEAVKSYECLTSTSVSEYFVVDQPNEKSQKVPQEALPIKLKADENDEITAKDSCLAQHEKLGKSSGKVKSTKKTHIKVTAVEKLEKEKTETLTLQSSSSSSSTASGGSIDLSSRVFCPFCMKKLGDKLTGTTHVKACAKNLPIEQVYEAIQLQEKQMKEWEKLGLVYPGFASTATASKKQKGGTVASGKGRGRKTKNTPADADLELALALSVSLHEEVESRISKENQFIIENGLENEIELAKIVTDGNSSEKDNFDNEGKYAKSKVEMPASAPAPIPTRRRGKKIPVETLPLYSVGSERKREIIGNRVTKILDDCENVEAEKYYVRDEVLKNIIEVPKRLIPLQNKTGDGGQELSLWKLAECQPETPEESFSVLELKDLSALELSFSCKGNVKQQDEPNPSVSERRFLVSESLSNEQSIATKTIETNSGKQISGQSYFAQPNARSERRGSRFSSKKSSLLKTLSPLIQDVARMLLNQMECDIIIYGREEKPIKCHRFMLSARCPNILNEVIVEESSLKATRCVIPLISYSHKAVQAFLWYIYTGLVESDEELLIEFNLLASTYNVEITKSNKTIITKPAITLCSVEIQTESVLTEDIFTMTENFTSPEKSPAKNTSYNSTSNDLNTTCEDLFKTYDYGVASISLSSPTVAERSNSANSDLANADDDNKSVDLFEDVDYNGEGGFLEEPQPLFDISLERRKSASSFCKEKLRQTQTVADDDDYLQELATPVSSFVSDSIVKKRSRSMSPLLDHSGDLYTATQVAEILKLRLDCGDVPEYTNKAIKKQKLDFSGELDARYDNSDIELEQHRFKEQELVGNDSYNGVIADNYEVLNNDSVVNTCKNNIYIDTPNIANKNGKRIRRSISTPNVSIKTSNGFPNFYNHQERCNLDEYDPLVDACDDSVFANIPDDAFSPKRSQFSPRKISSILNHESSELSQTTSRSMKSFSQRKPISEADTSSSDNSQGKKEGRLKRKGKPTMPKIKLRSGKAQSKANVSQPVPVDQSVVNNDKSPMLNYSLIDTPILKEELRRYGIKPLPRSKAKVLLRHIYKETHK
ncbi:unnamed protein product [Orchesella dallaii]|uniref:BTB domain-containing protein n=1 Tax=Orchesella dallaii TaxID=48710 RepID=A0ABP1RDC3_9HEXA